MKIKTRHFIALLALAWCPYAGAQETVPPQGSAAPTQQAGYFDFLGGLAYTDNALLTSSQQTGDGIGMAGFSADYMRKGNLTLNLLGNLERLEYLHHSFAGSFYGQFFGLGVLGKPTDLLQWQLAENFGEEMTDPLAAPTPVNLQTINEVSTGPQINFHFGLTYRLTLSGRYSRTTYQRSPFDSQTYRGGVQFQHELSGASSLSVEASTAHTRYVDSYAVRSYFSGSNGYDIQSASFLYEARFVRTQVLLRAGYNSIRYGGASARGQPLYQVRLSRRISPFSTVYIGGQQTYSSNGESLSSPGARVGLQVGATLNPGYAVAQPFSHRAADVGWLFHRARTSLALTGSYGEDVYQQTVSTQQPNQQDESAAAVLGRQLSPTTMVRLRVDGYWIHYAGVGARSRREDMQLTFSKRMARTTISLYVERQQQSGASGQSAFFSTSYHDDRVGIYVTYDLVGARSMGALPLGITGMGAFAGE